MKTRKAELVVPFEVLQPFCKSLLDNPDISGQIIAMSPDEESVVLEVSYQKEDSYTIDSLEDELETLIEEMECEEEEQDDEDEDDKEDD